MSTEFGLTSFIKRARFVSFMIALSRLLGYGRDMLFASSFGATFMADAFFVAFMIPNTLRRLLAEGALTSSFVPIFSHYLGKGKKEAHIFSNTIFFILLFTLLLIHLAAVFFLPPFLKILAPGFLQKGVYPVALKLAQIMFPYIFFASLSALCMGILNALGHFFIPFLSPICFNLLLISSLLFFCKSVTHLAFTVIAAGSFQLLLHLLVLPRYGFFPSLSFSFKHPGLSQIFGMILPAFGSFLVYQANIMVDKAIASFLPEGAISSLYYANRLILLPVSLFGVALSTTALPQLSLHAAKGEKEKFADTVSLGMQILVFLAIPATTGLLLFGKPIIKALFQRGAFLFKDTESVYLALFFYAFGIISYGMQRFLISAFYAMKKTLLPLKISLLALLCNVVGSLILMHPLRQGGIALATALSSFLNTFLLSLHLSKCVQIKWYNICKTAFCTLLCLPALCTCFLLYRVMGENFFSVIVCVLSAVFALIFCAKIFKIQGVELLWRRG